MNKRANKHTKENTNSSASSGETAVGNAADDLFSRVLMAEPEVLPMLRPPSEDEQIGYYNGLPSGPRLVGRASSEAKPWLSFEAQERAWSQMKQQPPWLMPVKKRMSNIGAHRIRTCWHKVEPFINLAVSRLPWTSIDVLRMCDIDHVPYGKEVTIDNPVVVWIGVEHHDIAWALVAEALRACRFVLDIDGLFDVDVQIRVSNVFPLTSPAELPSQPSSHAVENRPDLKDFRATIGTSMSHWACPYAIGTLGLFISPDTTAGNEDAETEQAPMWAVTCRHVGLPKDADPENKPYRSQESEASSRHLICLPSDKATDEKLRRLEGKKKSCNKIVLESGREQDKAALEQLETTLDAARVFSTREARVSGSVLFAPPIAKEESAWPPQSSPITWFKDYCVVHMQRDNFPELETLTNSIDLSYVLRDNGFAVKLRSAQKLNQPDFEFPLDDIVTVNGMIPMSEMRSPPGDFENLMHDNCIIVVKKGITTDITFGCPSELMSTVRGLDDKITTQEWAILGTFDSRRSAFSQEGDSGAAVVGLDGRLGGFLTRGVGDRQGFQVDITYVTPAELVFSDIEKEMGCKVVIR